MKEKLVQREKGREKGRLCGKKRPRAGGNVTAVTDQRHIWRPHPRDDEVTVDVKSRRKRPKPMKRQWR